MSLEVIVSDMVKLIYVRLHIYILFIVKVSIAFWLGNGVKQPPLWNNYNDKKTV